MENLHNPLRYIIIGLEHDDTPGLTRHLQFYLELKGARQYCILILMSQCDGAISDFVQVMRW